MLTMAYEVHCQPMPTPAIMASILMQDAIHIRLCYDGPEVASGEMDIDQVVEALKGFSSAYSKVSAEIAPEAYQQLKVTAIRQSSFDVDIAALLVIASQTGVADTIKTYASAAKTVFGIIMGVIGLKKHTKSLPYSTKFDVVKGNVTVINAEHVEVHITRDAFEMFQSGKIDGDLGKITAPLEEGKIDLAQLKETDADGSEVSVTSSERKYFLPPTEVTTTSQVEIPGTLISFSKRTNKGMFEFNDGRTAKYVFVGDDKEKFWRVFGHKGQVRIVADISFDESLAPLRLEIKSAEPRQQALPLLDEQSGGPEKPVED